MATSGAAPIGPVSLTVRYTEGDDKKIDLFDFTDKINALQEQLEKAQQGMGDAGTTYTTQFEQLQKDLDGIKDKYKKVVSDLFGPTEDTTKMKYYKYKNKYMKLKENGL
jgi:predicted  nucleic acid-binding Zn-ribbon protein